MPGSGGLRTGSPNKSTADARKAIAEFVDGNAHRLVDWLDRVSDDNPAKAFELFQSVVEYHIPKLARTETTLTGNIVMAAASMTDDQIIELMCQKQSSS